MGSQKRQLLQRYCLGLFSTIPRQILNFKTIKTRGRIPFTKSYYVISSECYTTRNVLNGTVTGTNTSELYPFAFADKNCAVIRKDSWSNETFKACEMWVYQSALNKELSCCDFVFDLLCSRGYKQTTYDPERCKPEDTEVNADPTALTTSSELTSQ
ncbi:uncharacterized protein LOC8023570 isoform X2 [Ixodes scapularis]|uniref:uncharacterized protein LOC8023570 isoform X2 n=1 Tax=Ixodes scapularis TaxID=6945 RepID=UPI001A9E0C0E|nr:uncharacterized protein LOC8023570 isoform X2 [Ixodes scapularis]